MARGLIDLFDSVIMLTWSDWPTEPRSNRYHYATRFARELPVYFVQCNGCGPEATFEKVAGHNIEIVRVPATYNFDHARSLIRTLSKKGVRRPLLWIYNWWFEEFIRYSPSPFRVYHATEDYFSRSKMLSQLTEQDLDGLKRVVGECDLVVAVSDGVSERYRSNTGYAGRLLTLKNGCDYAFWRDTEAHDFRPTSPTSNVALYQGGINERLDFELLHALAEQMPDWQFWFCGRSSNAPADWTKLKSNPNVRDFGFLDPEGVAALAREARVGLIPFKREDFLERSLPLKSYEYAACGLPIVTTPISELERDGALFQIATSAKEFATAIRQVGPTRGDPLAVARRMASAEETSYDRRYEELRCEIFNLMKARRSHDVTANVLVLYEQKSIHVPAIRSNLEAFARYSRHEIFFMPVPRPDLGTQDIDAQFDLSMFDAVVIHFSVRIAFESHVSSGLASALISYCGPKILTIQDEYDRVETTRRFIEQFGIATVFTTVPPEALDYVYPRVRFPDVEFIQVLTGYVDEADSIEHYAMPLAERAIFIGYRGRQLPHQYGDLGHEKFRIGLDVRRFAVERGLRVDIEVDDSLRIYGNDWYRFVGSCRAMLGTESGCNVFDFDGVLTDLAVEHAAMPYEEFRSRFLAGREDKPIMNQVSPKILEAIGMRTALILFEGAYSGVVQPHRHYIPLKKDYSNIEEVLRLIADDQFVSELTERAYREIYKSGRYTYRKFLGNVDQCIDQRVNGRRRARFVSMPVLTSFGSHGPSVPLSLLHGGLGFISNAIVEPKTIRELLDDADQQRQMEQQIVLEIEPLQPAFAAVDEGAPVVVIAAACVSDDAPILLSPLIRSKRFLAGRYIWRLMPKATRHRVVNYLRSKKARSHLGAPDIELRIGKVVWRRLPLKVRIRIVNLLD